MSTAQLPDVLTARMASYRGRDLVEQSVDADTVNLADDDLDFPDAIGRGEAPGRPPLRWVKVPRAAVDRRYRRTVLAVWDGEPVAITSVQGGRAGFWYSESQQWAEEHELSGSRHEGGWRGSAPVDELGDIRISETDIP